MSDYETLNAGPVRRLHMPVIDDPSFKVFDTLRCPKCPNGGQIMTTNDGNRNQSCLSCKTVLMVDGKLVNQTENKSENKSEMCDCPKGKIKYSVLKLDKNGNHLCVDCNKIEKLKGNTTTQKKDNNQRISSFMPDHMQDYMKELYDIHNRIHNTNHTEQKDEKYTDGELEIYSEDDPDMPDYMKELSELVNQKK